MAGEENSHETREFTSREVDSLCMFPRGASLLSEANHNLRVDLVTNSAPLLVLAIEHPDGLEVSVWRDLSMDPDEIVWAIAIITVNAWWLRGIQWVAPLVLAEGIMWLLDHINRILAGRPITRPELLGGAIFVLVWFLMDLHQYVAWLHANEVAGGLDTVT
jgi:hypothetical protein